MNLTRKQLATIGLLSFVCGMAGAAFVLFLAPAPRILKGVVTRNLVIVDGKNRPRITMGMFDQSRAVLTVIGRSPNAGCLITAGGEKPTIELVKEDGKTVLWEVP